MLYRLHINVGRAGLLILGALTFIMFGLEQKGYAQCGTNSITAENCLPGNPASEWDVSTGNAGDPTIQGFATDISVNQGGTVSFKISTPAKAYAINIYRMGYYAGLGARKVATITPGVTLPQTQPACLSDAATGLIDCGNWGISASWQVPANATSGIYFAHLVRADTGGDSHIVFVVRNDSSHSAILYQTADESWQAYNFYGGGSFYGPGSATFDIYNRATKISYNRPFFTRSFSIEKETWVFGPEFPMVQWLEANGYDVSYFTGVDAARSGSLIKNHRIYMDSGHDEYWAGPQRDSVQAARDAGVNLAFFSGNEMFWKTRWENSIDGSNTPNRTLVCYKETFSFAKSDPDDPPTWTGTWRDPTNSPPADGGRPENNLTGTLFMVNGTGADNDGSLSIKVPYADGKMRFWRNTAVAALAPNATYTLPPSSLAYEWDEDPDNGVRPAGAFHLSTSTYTLTTDLLLDYGGVYGAGSATHHLMLYRAPSGALVFGAGTVNWSWGLSSQHDNPFSFDTPAPDLNMQQATVNLFADMGVQPTTPQVGIVAAVASSDTVPPTSTIVAPTSGTPVTATSPISVTGTASDVGGSVGGVEISTDAGATWHPAAGRENWTYTWTPTLAGSITLLSRAVDDSGNIEHPSAGVTVSVIPHACPCSLWASSTTPVTADSGDGGAVEVGVKFRADADGSILGVRFYKAAANTGTHVGHIWSSAGALLGTATFTGESGSGWQQVNFSAPIPVSASATYVASYFAPNGHYADDSDFFVQSGVDNPPLHALANGVDGQNAVFTYGTSGGFPTTSYASSNYWVDVVYTSSNTYGISGTIGGYGGAGAALTASGPTNLATTADSSGNYSFDGLVNGTYIVSVSNAGVSFTPPSQTVTINNSALTGINFTALVTQPISISGTITGGGGATMQLSGAANGIAVADASGNYSFGGLLSGAYILTPSESGFIFAPGTQSVVLSGSSATSVNFQATVCNCRSIWSPSATPMVSDSGDGTPVELGVKFRADAPGYIVGVRFYKATANTGIHLGHLWTSTGTLLGSASFSSESATGWQQVTFPTPIAISANTTYIASYFTPAGHYSADTNIFAAAGVDAPPLHALAAGVDGPNGVFFYSSTGGFPVNTYASTNYWVDVVYMPGQSHNVSGTITGGAGAAVTLLQSGFISAAVTADSAGNYAFNGVYPGTYAVTPNIAQSISVPQDLPITVSTGDVSGVNFTVSSLCPCSTIWQPTSMPVVTDNGDPTPFELGTKFRADSDGYILGIRFYKAPANAGLHTANLWSATGSLLGTATYTNESASGWQQTTFTTPVPVSAGTTYIASYFTSSGHSAEDNSYFVSGGVDSPPLHALANGSDGSNGVYAASATSAYPASSYEASNYWVDTLYAPSTTYTLGGVITGPGASSATITLSGASTAATVPTASGGYSFAGLVNGTYTVTAASPGFAITPASQTVVINSSHSLAVNFTSTLPAHAISGTISGGAGDTVSLSGLSTATTTVDGSGHYSFAGLVDGNYVITPGTAGFVTTPSSQASTLSGSDLIVNFTAVSQPSSISGTIDGGAGAAVALSGPASMGTVADQNGNYRFSGLVAGSYTVVPAAAGAVFTPSSLTVAIAGSNLSGLNFAVPSGCPCDTLWAPSAIPATIDAGDPSPVELGVKFRADADGYVIGVRFYKASLNVGTHIGNLWSSTGTLLGTATFTNDSNSGWQQVLFSSPVPVTANTTYVASYFAPGGHYSGDTGFFINSGIDTPPLHALANGVDGQNGVYAYGGVSTFPSASFNAGNYWVDVIYTPTTTFSISGVISGPGAAGATVTLSGSSAGSTVADSAGRFTFSGVSNGAYTVTPSLAGYSYSPSSLGATIGNAHVLGLAFSSTTQTYSLSGSIAGAGGVGAVVTLSGTANATTTASLTGAYTFSGLTDGTYLVVASNTGYSFTPNNQVVALNGANAAANFTSVAQTFSITGTIAGAGGAGATIILGGSANASTTASAGGTYIFNALTNGSYTVTANKAGYVITPASQAITLNGANASANFSAAGQTYSITGSVSGPGGASAVVTLSGAAAAAVTASTTGTYTFGGLVNGNYAVAVSKLGYSFTPASQPVSINAANASANFTSAQTFSITGSISGAGGSGATVQLTGGSSASTTASATGTYTFSGLSKGNYTVAVTAAGYTFTPASRAITISTANASANFTSVLKTYTITGTISGPGGSGATVQLTGAATTSASANRSGVYTFTNVVSGSYVVTPVKTGYVFNPTSTGATVTTANVAINFSSAAMTYSISGTISGAGASAASVTLSGAAKATTTASASGTYSFSGLVNGNYSVAAGHNGYVFSPASQAISLNGANATANFNASVATYTIAGKISGAGGSGATIQLSGASAATVTANASGAYSFVSVMNGSYIVTPTKTGYGFSPTSAAVTINGTNGTATFTSSVSTYNIVVTISGAGGPGATVKLTGAANSSARANSSGIATFTGIRSGSYTLTASKSGYNFAPVSQAITVNQGNAAASFVSSIQTGP